MPVGLLAAAILMVNNIRDIDTDRRAGKRTLAVRLGRLSARRAYSWRRWCCAYVIVALVAVFEGWPGCCCVAFGAVGAPDPEVFTRTDGAALNAALAARAAAGVFSLLLSAGLLLAE